MKRAFLAFAAVAAWTSVALAQITAQDGAPQPSLPSQWDFWPFGPGYGETWLPVAARFLFVAVILFLVGLFLRLLMGPKGPLRDKWIDEEAAEEIAQELEELEQQYAAGELDEYTYKRMKKQLTR